MIFRVVFVVVIIYAQAYGHWIDENFVDEINRKAKTWKASLKNYDNFTENELRNLANVLGYHSDKDYVFIIKKYLLDKTVVIPSSFDARKKWPLCSIGSIRDQKKCGGSWAFAAVSVMSDRLCIASNNIVDFTFSPEELLRCCQDCGNGCDGGYIFPPFDYWKDIGIPSGGDQSSNLGCKPFNSTIDKQLPCIKKCVNGYNKTLEEDARHGIDAYRVLQSVQQIQMDIMNFGPVVASMDIYKDFYIYQEGIYEHVSWDLVGRAAVKIIGWGEINDTPYWLVANSWGRKFGDEGLIRVLRGSNHCGIEYEVTGATPNTDTE
ncbi:cathepsin B-like [Diorhabda carinulata]|uniref:cathepsin B-like n=1 Tax=Diorhabda carinulata TaxID=1163345 RepID=UPI0025A1329F|nr:cathepsin B-like [Diorhabda carinulata]